MKFLNQNKKPLVQVKNKGFILKSALKKILALSAFLIFTFSLISFLLPLLKALLPAFSTQKNSALPYSFFKILKIASFTFFQAFVSVLIAVLIGIPGGFFLAHKKFPGQKFLYSLASVPLCLPPLIVVLGYISTFGMNGFFNRFFMAVFNLSEPPLKFLYSFWGIVLVQGFYNFPLIMVSVADSWKSVDLNQINSARLLGAGEIKIFFSITFHQIFSGLISACIPVFLYCFFSFMIVLLFASPGTSTLELEIYHAARSTLDFNLASRLSLIETLFALLTIFWWSVWEKKGRRNHQMQFSEFKKTRLQGKEILGFSFYILLITVFFLLPLFSIVLGSFTSKTGGKNHLSLEAWKKIWEFKDFLPSLKNTIFVAALTSVLCVICGFFYSSIIRLKKQNRFSSFFTTVPLLPMAVSSVTIGIGMSSIFKNSSFLILVASQTALTWPFAFRQIFAQMTKIPQSVIDSAKLLCKNPLECVFKILLPYSWRGIISACGFCFAISSGDATLPLVLSMQKFSTLSLFTYRLAGSFRFTHACISGLILSFICALSFLLAKRMEKK